MASATVIEFRLPLLRSQFIQTLTNTARPIITEILSIDITRMYSWINCRHNYLHCALSITGYPSRSKKHGWRRFIASRNITRSPWKRISISNYTPASLCLRQSSHRPLRAWLPRKTLANLVTSKIYDEEIWDTETLVWPLLLTDDIVDKVARSPKRSIIGLVQSFD